MQGLQVNVSWYDGWDCCGRGNEAESEVWAGAVGLGAEVEVEVGGEELVVSRKRGVEWRRRWKRAKVRGDERWRVWLLRVEIGVLTDAVREENRRWTGD